MKLYSLALSPFAARVRLAIYRKGLDIDIVTPPEGGTRGDAYLALNPLGQVPALELDNGFVLPESATILEYLEDVFPAPSLRPTNIQDLARARLFLRLPDIHFQGAPRVLIGMRRSGQRDPEKFNTAIGHLRDGLRFIEHYINGPEWAVGDRASLGDCALVPVLNVISRVETASGIEDLIASNPKLNAYSQTAQLDATNARVISEQNIAFARMMEQTA